MTFGSLFAGIGGMDLGLERAGMECRWQVEIDPFCRKVLAKHWPKVKRYEDIRTVNWGEVERVDLIAGGFPCQPVSLAGRRQAQDDDRWLWPEFARALSERQPRIALIENVPGLLSRGMGDVVRGLASIGYVARWSPVPACAMGAPYTRERLFIVAHRDGDDSLGWRGDDSVGWVGLAAEATETRNAGGSQWAVEPGVGRVVPRVPDRMDRCHALGNAVVPQVSEWIGRRILDIRRESL